MGADECDTRALTGHGRRAIGSVSHQGDSALPRWGHVDLSRRVKVPIRRCWHQLQQPGNLPADSLVDRAERLLLLSPVSQIDPKSRGRKAKTGLRIRVAAR